MENKILIEPIVIKLKDTINDYNQFEKNFDNTLKSLGDEQKQMILKDYPVVYIHTWVKSKHDKYNWYGVYVGETNNILRRTGQHYDKGKKKKNYWAKNLKDKSETYVFVLGHEYFNKSLTLDIENKFMHYLNCVPAIQDITNGRDNYQNKYYTSEYFEEIFDKLWTQLRIQSKDERLFPDREELERSALFKCSPFNKLFEDQEKAKDQIVKKIDEVLNSTKGNEHALILVEGDAGTGKSVLMSNLFKDLLKKYENTSYDEDNDDDDENDEFDDDKNITIKNKKNRCALIVNHDEQAKVYSQIFKKIGYDQHVFGPTEFINRHSKDTKVNNSIVSRQPDDIIDIAFIDEAHLLQTQFNQAFIGDFKDKEKRKPQTQLEAIINRAKVTIAMIDPKQIVRTDQYFDPYNDIKKLRNKSKVNIKLNLQKRMQMEDESLQKWFDEFSKEGKFKEIPYNEKYEIKVFDDVNKMYEAIREKSEKEETKLSRLIATYDWDYKKDKKENSDMWTVDIGKFSKPWNYEIEDKQEGFDSSKIKGQAWAEQAHTIDEIGSTYTIQGFDLHYPGVILGNSIKLKSTKPDKDGYYHIKFDPDASSNKKITNRSDINDKKNKEMIERLIRNEFYVLTSRGVNGLYMYACDKDLRDVLNKLYNNSKPYPTDEVEEEILLVADSQKSNAEIGTYCINLDE